MIAGENQNVFGIFQFNGINILVDGVGRALIPFFIDSVLRRQHVDVLVEKLRQEKEDARYKAWLKELRSRTKFAVNYQALEQ